MLIAVIVLNLALALYGFYLTWQMWRLRQAFSRAADALVVAEQQAYQVLYGAPAALERPQESAQQLRQTYRQLMPKIRQAQQAYALLGMGRSTFLTPLLTQRSKKFATKSSTGRMNRG
jgi:ribosomal protein S18 acetylase RimI-like enzyme